MHEVLTYVISPLILALLGICAYFLREIHADFKQLKVKMDDSQVAVGKLETRVEHAEDRLNKIENFIAKSSV